MAGQSIVDVGKFLERYGWKVGENPAFGSGKVGKHAPTSYHYGGQAIDVTVPHGKDLAPAYEGGKPIPWQQRTGELSWRAKKAGIFTEALGPGDKGHETHVHLALKDKAQTSPELLEWVATGRWKTPQGTLSDVMPAGTVQQQSATPTQTQKGNTYIILPGAKADSASASDFLNAFVQQALESKKPEVSPAYNPTALLTQALFQTPNYLT
jgi:hypothetical protein